MNKAETRAQQAKDALASKKQKMEPGVITPSTSGSLNFAVSAPKKRLTEEEDVDFPNNLDFLNDSGDFDSAQLAKRSSGPIPAAPQRSFQVSSTPPLDTFSPGILQRQQQQVQGRADLQENYAGTISWLLHGGVSLPELASALNMNHNTSIAPQGGGPLLLSPTPMMPLPRTVNENTDNIKTADFTEEVISIFGNNSSGYQLMPPMPEISVRKEQDLTLDEDLQDLFAV
jgi:hypothetical protein